MIEKYIKIHENATKTLESEIVPHLVDENVFSVLTKAQAAWQSLLKPLLDIAEADDASLAYVRRCFDLTCRNATLGPILARRLSPTADILGKDARDLIGAIAKVATPNGLKSALSEDEQLAIEPYVVGSRAAVNSVSPFGEDFTLPAPRTELYWLPASTSVIERLFSRTAYSLTDYRARMAAESVEMLVLVSEWTRRTDVRKVSERQLASADVARFEALNLN